jgi:hypothetical protein
MRARSWSVVLSIVVLAAACDEDDALSVGADAGPPDAMGVPNLDRTPCVPDETVPVPAGRCGGGGAPDCRTWIKVDVPGAVCSNGSQYKIFVNYSDTSNNLVVMFEPGGACWDYPSCSGVGGIRGAANPNGVPDNHMDTYQFLNLLRRSDDNPAKDYNLVFVPYCTGDVHTGNRVATYPDPAGGDPLTYRHVGHDNVMKTIAWLKDRFTAIPKLLVTGCSAGGIGALQNYYFVREALTGAQCGYLLDDSGPAFHSSGPSKQLHDEIFEAWNLDPVLDELRGKVDFDVDALKEDFGLVNVLLADRYPKDRIGLTVYRMDLNYSLYSYQRFFPGSSEADIHAKWEEDLAALMTTYDTRANMAYFIPDFRSDNCSHCVSIPPLDHDLGTILGMPWLGSEIQSAGLDLRDFTADLLDPTVPLASYLEARDAASAFTAEESAACMAGGG